VRTLSSIHKRKIVTESGRKVGRCYDIRAELTQSSLRITGLVVGRRGRLEHFGVRGQAGAIGVRGQAGATAERVRDSDVIPWDAVVRFERQTIVVRDPWSAA
jgi:sporulation protein YlmC with PRC-barrel domain